MRNKCAKCGSGNITIAKCYNPRKRGDETRIICRDCKYIEDGWTDY